MKFNKSDIITLEIMWRRKMDYAEAIKTLRKRMLITQTELAKLIGVAFVSVNRWENGAYEPTMKAKRKIAPLFKEHNIEVK